MLLWRIQNTFLREKTVVCHESIRTTTILSYAYFFPIPHFFRATLAPRLDQNRFGSRRKMKKILRSNDPRRKEERPHLNFLSVAVVVVFWAAHSEFPDRKKKSPQSEKWGDVSLVGAFNAGEETKLPVRKGDINERRWEKKKIGRDLPFFAGKHVSHRLCKICSR